MLFMSRWPLRLLEPYVKGFFSFLVFLTNRPSKASYYIIKLMPIKRYTRRVTSTHPYHSYHHRRFVPLKRRSYMKLLFLLPIIFVGVGVFMAVLYARPLPTVAATTVKTQPINTTQPMITWPSASQAAFGTTEQGLLENKPGEVARPTASTAKVLTALVVLEKRPLKLGEQGPKITMTQADIDSYNQYYAQDGSLAQVVVGLELTQYQMLQGILLVSANNYADTLAIWAFGSLEKYREAATQYVAEHNMKDTVVGTDASGFSPSTMSTASDLTRLGIAAMNQPVIAEIAAQESVILPVAGLKNSTNHLLGVDGVVGLKTGNTNEAGGVYIFAAKYALDQTHSTVIVGAVQGEPTVLAAMGEARRILSQVKPYFVKAEPIKKDQAIAVYNAPWGQKVEAVAVQDIILIAWPGKKIETKVHLERTAPSSVTGSSVGKVKIDRYSSDVVLNDPLQMPDWKWRIWREARI